MRSDRYSTDADKVNAAENASPAPETEATQFEAQTADQAEEPSGAEAAPETVTEDNKSEKEGRRSRKKRSGKEVKLTKDSESVDLSKLKKRELLEIMLRQGEEIDKLRDQVADLQRQLDDRNIRIEKAGTLAQASLELTKIFDEADKAVRIYLENIRRRTNG